MVCCDVVLQLIRPDLVASFATPSLIPAHLILFGRYLPLGQTVQTYQDRFTGFLETIHTTASLSS